jgi:hypothetical protein
MIIGAYFPTFSGEFILDDKPFVKENVDIRSFRSPIFYLLQEDGISERDKGRASSGYYRPLASFTYTLDLKIWGSKSSGFRTTNLVLHLISCLFLYLCLERVTHKDAAFTAALLFGLHPVNTEAVSWVASRNNILVTLCSLGSFYFYMRRSQEGRRWHGALSLLFFCLALLSKEFALMLPLIFFLFDRTASKDGFFRKRIWGYFAFSAILIGYLGLRQSAVGSLAPEYRAGGGGLQAVCFAPWLLMENIRLVLLPAGLHNFVVGYPGDCPGREFALGIVGVVLFLVLLWRWRNHKVVLFSVCSFLAGLFPVLNIWPTSATSLVSMRWLYFPMSFLSFAAAWGIARIGNARKPFLIYALTACACIYLASYSFVLNEFLWKREKGFFEREVKVFGNTFFAGDLAGLLHVGGKWAEAEEYYKMAAAGHVPDRGRHLINYAVLLIQLQRPEDALHTLEEAEKERMNPHEMGSLHNTRGAAQLKLQQCGRAVQSFQKALVFRPSASFERNLGEAYKCEEVRR